MNVQFLRERIAEALGYLEQLPPGIDPEPDINNASPEDATFHVGGIVAKILRSALNGEAWPDPVSLSPKELEVAARLEPIIGREFAEDVAIVSGMTEEAFNRLYRGHFVNRDYQQ